VGLKSIWRQIPSIVVCSVARLAAACALVAVLGGVYVLAIRPSLLHWGATPAEIAAPLPEDGIVAHPAFDATRAITIHARPQAIWPWLAQMGYRRAGFYGYDPIEGLGNGGGIRSAQTILPQFQNPHVGDVLPISAVASLRFGPIAPGRSLVWEGVQSPPDGVYIWALQPLDAEHTRLISRIRWRYVPGAEGTALGVFTEFTDHVAVREILRGVRDRAEGRPPKPLWMQWAELCAWMLAFFELALGLVLILSGPRWPKAWLLALGAGLLLQFVLYGPAPAWVDAILPWAYLALLSCLLPRRHVTAPAASGTFRSASGCG